MVQDSLEKLLMEETTSDDVIKAQIVQEFVYRRSATIFALQNYVPVRALSMLDVTMNYPSEMTAEWPLGEGAIPQPSKIVWANYSMHLLKGAVRYALTDEAVLSQMQQWQTSVMLRRAAEALAVIQYNDIAKTIHDNNTDTDASTAPWDGASADIEKDILNAWTEIMTASNLQVEDMNNLLVIVPTAVWAYLLKSRLWGNLTLNTAQYLKQSFGITLIPTKHASYADDVIVLHPGPADDPTCVLGQLTNPPFPLTESQRVMGVGQDYLTRMWFKTKVTPDSDTVATSSRIFKITNVVT